MMGSIKHILKRSGAVAAVAFAFAAAPAMAQSTRTFVSAFGDDAQPCSRTAPCRTFATAYDRTATNGEINCIDNGSYGPITITRSMTIDCTGAKAGVIINAGSAITINAGANDTVQLRSIEINGLTTGTNGVRVLQVGKLFIERLHIRNFANSGGGGIAMTPSNAGARLFVNDSSVVNSGIGLLIQPAGVGGATVVADRLLIQGGGGAAIRGIYASGESNGLEVRNVQLSGNAHGVLLNVSNGSVLAGVQDSAITNNSFNGLAASGNAQIWVGRTTVMRNGTGVLAAGGGAVVSYGDNQLFGNTSNGSFTLTPPN